MMTTLRQLSLSLMILSFKQLREEQTLNSPRNSKIGLFSTSAKKTSQLRIRQLYYQNKKLSFSPERIRKRKS
jgi:hypothetical protein